MFLQDKNNFCYKLIPNYAKFRFMEKNYFVLFKKNSSYSLINGPCIFFIIHIRVFMIEIKILIFMKIKEIVIEDFLF